MGREFYTRAAGDDENRFNELAKLDMGGKLFEKVADIRAGKEPDISAKLLDAYMAKREKEGPPIVTLPLDDPRVAKGDLYYAHGTGVDDKGKPVFNHPTGGEWKGDEKFVAQGTIGPDGKFVGVAVAQKPDGSFVDADGSGFFGGSAFDTEHGLTGKEKDPIPSNIKVPANKVTPDGLKAFEANMVAEQKAQAELKAAEDRKTKSSAAYKSMVDGFKGLSPEVLKDPVKIQAGIDAGFIDASVKPILDQKATAELAAGQAKEKLAGADVELDKTRPVVPTRIAQAKM